MPGLIDDSSTICKTFEISWAIYKFPSNPDKYYHLHFIDEEIEVQVK